MKILFFSSFAHLVLERSGSRTSGGAELQVALLARELARHGEEVVIAGGDVGQEDRVVLDGILTRNAGKFHTGRILEMMRAIPRVVRVLREEHPEWVVVMGWTAWLFILWLLRPFLGYKLDFICALDSEINGEYRRENPVFGSLFEFAVRRCDARHSITRDQSEVFKRRGMDCTFYRYLLVPRGAPQSLEKNIDLLWVSRCQPIKRPHLFLDLAESLPEARCRMICPCEDRGLWNSVVERAATIPNLEFVEKVPYHEIQEYYDRSHVFVNTSTFEGFPNSFIQAGLGKAALLSICVDPDGMIRVFGSGMMSGERKGDLVRAARLMLADKTKLLAMQEGSARMVAEWLDNKENVERFLTGLDRRGQTR
jgi:glycosyltransferase involved in cell wall biosynthesis